MKLNGRTLKRRLFGLTTLPTRVARARYFRGHGVHSPFVYAIVRQVFMKSRLATEEHVLFDALVARNFVRRRAVQMQNLYTHCGYGSWAIDALTNPCDLCILTEAVGEPETRELVTRAVRRGTTVALMSPYNGRERAELCRRLAEAHACTSVDNRGYLLLFTNPALPKQHYRI